MQSYSNEVVENLYDLPPGLECPKCFSNDCLCEFVVSLRCIKSYLEPIWHVNNTRGSVTRFRKGEAYKARFKNNVYLIVDEEGSRHQFLGDLERFFKVEMNSI